MKTIAVVYPGFKRDRDGRLTESKLVLVETNEFIGRKMLVPDKPREETGSREETRERRRKNYITF